MDHDSFFDSSQAESCNMPDRMDTTKKSLTSLPDELLLDVVSYLDSKSLKNLRSTCARFGRFVNRADIIKRERKEKLSRRVNRIYFINWMMGTENSLKDIEERIEQLIEPAKAYCERLIAICKDKEDLQGVEEFTAYLDNQRIAEATYLLNVWILRFVMQKDPADQARLGRTVDVEYTLYTQGNTRQKRKREPPLASRPKVGHYNLNFVYLEPFRTPPAIDKHGQGLVERARLSKGNDQSSNATLDALRKALESHISGRLKATWYTNKVDNNWSKQLDITD
ncbi:hypothetical protein EPUS_08655 [Endocarpon pusillum Z07020]|uniref:F-box domain-containing protein n=1 Tax=Endocarpon pusillum (strain Z07020 / HMAS-L-300199) TaxID=1263415 RepID=U1G8A8_ENDPU|nr:uncharacterized protein EPUS_08655 [Endocarpon pusillum Z07020]ERF68218.1 hypothetical protein EPUS_08655 [Endocarpon pusillum Z07020]